MRRSRWLRRWFVAELSSPSAGSAIAFTLGLVASATGPALVAHLALGYPMGRLRHRAYQVVVGGGYVVLTGLVGLAGATVFDPGSIGCGSCPGNLLLISSDPGLFDAVDRLGVVVSAGWLLVAFASTVWRAVAAGPGARGALRPVAGAAAVLLGANAAPYLSSMSSGRLGTGGPALLVWEIEGAVLLLLACALGVELWRMHRARRSLTRLVVDLADSAPGRLREALAKRLHDSTLLVAYPIEGGRHVDAEAQEVSLAAAADRSVTRLTRGGAELATLLHRPGTLGRAQQIDELVTSVQLALESERLAAEDLAQLAEIRSSGARIVAAGDAERRRIERDLHDGAQQRLVALLLTLRVIQAEVGVPALVDVEAELRRTIDDLRAIANGVSPVLLKDAGLRPALAALAESRRLVIEGDIERCPDVVESTVYQLVARLSDAGPASVRIDRELSQLFVEVSVAGRPDSVVDIEDRVRTLNGQLDLVVGEAATRATLVLPIDQPA